MSALVVGIGNAAAMIAPGQESVAREHLQNLRRVAERAVALVRDLSLLLRPSMLDDLGLIPALQWQARETSRTQNIPVHIEAGSAPDDLPDEYKTAIYRIVQEALHNSTRHANAKSIQVRLEQKDARLLLSIYDDGQGFNPQTDKGVGLLGMQERVTHLHGNFRIESRVGQGTRILVELPLVNQSVGAA